MTDHAGARPGMRRARTSAAIRVAWCLTLDRGGLPDPRRPRWYRNLPHGKARGRFVRRGLPREVARALRTSGF